MDRLFKQIRKIHKHDPFHGNVTIEYPHENDDLTAMSITCRVPKKSWFVVDGWGDWCGSEDNLSSFVFKITFNDDFLESMPNIRCESDDIHHPNIEPACAGGEVCANFLMADEWDQDTTLEGLISMLFGLLQSPNWDDPLHNLSSREDSSSSEF